MNNQTMQSLSPNRLSMLADPCAASTEYEVVAVIAAAAVTCKVLQALQVGNGKAGQASGNVAYQTSRHL